MATSVQTCLPSSCKSQHNMKVMSKSPNILRRSSMRQNTANRKSAVERLEESKANYVKSERVLDSKQEFKNSSHLHISTGPQFDKFLKPPAKLPPENIKNANTSDELKLSYLRLHSVPAQTQISKSPPAVRARAKSYSEFRDAQVSRKHSFASQCSRHRIEVLIDIESQLKKLINSGSRENVSSGNDGFILGNAHSEAQIIPKIIKPAEVPKVRRGYSDPVRKSCWVPSDLSPDSNMCIHKSMPDLSPSPCSIPIPSSSLSSGDSDDLMINSDYTEPEPYYPPKQQAPMQHSRGMSKLEQDDTFDLHKEPRRFSNGSGMLHLTPYYPSQTQLPRKTVSRSKSDVSHRYSKRNPEYYPRKNNNYTTAEIERFFDSMGLDINVWHNLTSPSVASSPPCFFNSISSIDSNEDRSSVCSDDSVPEPPREGLRNHDLRVHGPLETSIVEKNARVIKWLYNCRKATGES